ncbi:MAG: class IV adenylate cyclase [Candidatus Omnitrophica bacterium]|nr:class IV adenylate cyclase [Candidatus Omnitrophota bacterium]
MTEIEVKILEIDRRPIEKKLIEWGARKQFDGRLRNLFFDFADGSVRKDKGVIRLRTKGERTVFAFKKILGQKKAKVCKEIEVEVSDFKAMQEILAGMGLKAWSNMLKHRTSYRLPHAQFEFDRYLGQYSHIPEFLEIEAENEALIWNYARRLGFRKEQILPWSTFELVKHYAKLGR